MASPASHPQPEHGVARADRRRGSGVAVALAGAAMVVGSGFLTWVDFAGSRLSGFAMSDLLTDLFDNLPETPPTVFGAAWYALPIGGVVAWLLVLRHRPPRATHAAGVLGWLIVGACITFVAMNVGVRVTPGPVVAGIGGAGLAASPWVERVARPRQRSTNAPY